MSEEVDSCDVLFPDHVFFLNVVGPSKSGKSVLVCNILKKLNCLSILQYGKIFFCYEYYQAEKFDPLKSIWKNNIVFLKGPFNADEFFKEYFPVNRDSNSEAWLLVLGKTLFDFL